ncbi:hypothetical protein EMEDMD4_440150 [Sinorhizobium medicae]|uniref:Uncharacterized protein n=1 Tax=Sinorhizobium medicae TaxID=110321 RepID=A0A508WZR0_9HYPH|nr:hypothetical protein EMEDMD4_440150 [Sinorhizobium medicae]
MSRQPAGFFSVARALFNSRKGLMYRALSSAARLIGRATVQRTGWAGIADQPKARHGAGLQDASAPACRSGCCTQRGKAVCGRFSLKPPVVLPVMRHQAA